MPMTRVLIVGDYQDSLNGVSVQMQYLNSLFGPSDSIQTELFSTRSRLSLKPLLLPRLLVKAWGCEIINAHGYSNFGFLSVVLCYFVARLLRRRLVIVYHGAAAEDFFDRFAWLRYFLRANQPIIVPSGFLESVFAKYGITSTVIPNGVDLDRFSYAARTSPKPRIVSTRNLFPVYNIKSAIAALALVQKHYPDAQLTIVGKGPLRHELESYVCQQAITGVTFLGGVKNADMPRILADHDIFLNASLQDNSPGSVLEAFASGLPVVSTNVGGIPYLVTDHETGLLVQPDDPEEMADRIVWILKNQPEAIAMAHRARESLQECDAGRLKALWQRALRGF